MTIYIYVYDWKLNRLDGCSDIRKKQHVALKCKQLPPFRVQTVVENRETFIIMALIIFSL